MSTTHTLFTFQIKQLFHSTNNDCTYLGYISAPSFTDRKFNPAGFASNSSSSCSSAYEFKELQVRPNIHLGGNPPEQ